MNDRYVVELGVANDPVTGELTPTFNAAGNVQFTDVMNATWYSNRRHAQMVADALGGTVRRLRPVITWELVTTEQPSHDRTLIYSEEGTPLGETW